MLISKADRRPCPICGHPTGDCVGESPKPAHIAGFATIDSLADSQQYLVEEEITEEVFIAPGVKTKILVHAKGSYISVTDAKKLGLL